MSENQDRDERPCLHCMIMDLLEDFFAEYPAPQGEPDTIDSDEVITALAKTVAELTCSQNGANRQQIIEKLMREIMDYDAEFRLGPAIRSSGSGGNIGKPLMIALGPCWLSVCCLEEAAQDSLRA
jgi:hypothetical protein